jgi:hypothetical protein
MSACNFSIGFTDPIDQLIEKARNGISSAGGTFNGGSDSGSYSIPTALGSISGTYTVQENSITFVINEKPGLIGCGKIEKELKRYLGQ